MTIPARINDKSDIMEQVLLKGDIAKLTADERVQYYNAVCNSMGLNPLTKPFEFITLNGKLQLYALRSCADQLRKINGVSLEIVSRDIEEGVLTVHVRAKLPDGRTDEDLGSVSFPETLRGDARANAELKAVTKAKRRATLSICGLGWLDETEVADIPAAAKRPGPPAPNVMLSPGHVSVDPVRHDPFTGEIDNPPQENKTRAAVTAGAQEKSDPSPAPAELTAAERYFSEQALQGTARLNTAWQNFSPTERRELKDKKEHYKKIAAQVDAQEGAEVG